MVLVSAMATEDSIIALTAANNTVTDNFFII
jgi:hypothetical protein